jgi:hypothetical protein
MVGLLAVRYISTTSRPAYRDGAGRDLAIAEMTGEGDDALAPRLLGTNVLSAVHLDADLDISVVA